MKNIKKALLTILLVMPLTVFAHGEEVLYTIFIQIISIVVFLIILAFITLNLKQKSILSGVYFFTVIIVFGSTSSIPYQNNMSTINFAIAFIPGIVGLMTYFLLKLNSKNIK
ncbi:hypothetical protein [Mucilaginibacter sp. OK098]|uniref:hypothetical protein n=1 Tax=Mucilaginibacter sp. OK098 TaxID=1855297 RepID=UPI000921F065|nr:hypothetical protein [Mucilaginibacter sp. OK098]SHM49106.1 hypothetical protein SAMN05216524_102280 [Mucilaginibacter sp. OK098]